MRLVLSIIGLLTSAEYQEAKLIAEDVIPLTLSTSAPLTLHLRPLTYYQWQAYLSTLPPHLSRPLSSTSPLIHHTLLGHLGSTPDLITFASRTYHYTHPQLPPSALSTFQHELRQLASAELCAYIDHQTSHSGYLYAYLDIDIDPRHHPPTPTPTPPPPHRLILELYPHIAPLAVRNFLALCQSFPTSSLPHPPTIPLPPSLHYLHSPIHRVVPHSFLQSGDPLHGYGDASHSTLGPTFPSESYALPHSTAGVLSMVSDRPHCNGSQFIVTLAARPEFDGRLVGFGRVVAGEGLLEECNRAVRVDGRGGGEGERVEGGLVLRHERPMYPVTIAQCDAFSTDLLSPSFTSWTTSSPSPTLTPPSTTSQPEGDGGGGKGGEGVQMTFLVIGPLSSGKTSLTNTLCSSPSIPTPTTGFELDHLHLPPHPPHPSTTITLYGLGGADNIRGYWPSYYDAAHAVVWVEEGEGRGGEGVGKGEGGKWGLQEVLEHGMVKGKPVLVVRNVRGGGEKGLGSGVAVGGERDGEGVGGVGRVIRVDARGDERGAREGLEWLVSQVRAQWAPLNERVQRDVLDAQQRARQERDRRRAQLAREKEEREARDRGEPTAPSKPTEEEKTAA